MARLAHEGVFVSLPGIDWGLSHTKAECVNHSYFLYLRSTGTKTVFASVDDFLCTDVVISFLK